MGSLDKAILTGFLCRVCSRINRAVVHIYGEEGLRLDLAGQMKQFLGIELEEDEYPKTVCSKCILRLKAHNDWVQMIYSSQEQLREKYEKRRRIDAASSRFVNQY